MTTPIYGVTRYSVFQPDSADWQLSQQDPDTYRDRLWAPERMAGRERVFLEWAVPIYQGFRDAHGYRHIVQYSPQMPDRWVDALRDAAATYDVLVLVDSADWQERRRAMLADLRERRVPAGPMAMLRVDDDDLLASDFLDRLLPLVTEAHGGFAASFGRGLTAEYADARLSHFGLSIQAMAAVGLAFIGHHDGAGRISLPSTTRSHSLLHRFLPTLLDSREVAYLRLLHDQQDRGLAGTTKNPTTTYAVPDLEETLARLFPTVVASSDTAPVRP